MVYLLLLKSKYSLFTKFFNLIAMSKGKKMKRSTQQGFTLIELIMVIVILGILAATALPKFVDLSGEAHEATANAVLGAANSAASMNFAAVLAGGNDAAGNTATAIAASATGATKLLSFLDAPSGWSASGSTLTATLGAKTYVITITPGETSTAKAVLTLTSS